MLARDAEVTVVVGWLQPLAARGLVDLLREDQGVGILATGLDDGEALECAVAQLAPRLVVVGESVEDRVLATLRSSRAETGVLILARDPRRRSETVLPAVQASCLAEGATTAEILDAVHRVARGERVRDTAEALGMHRRHRNVPQLLTPRQTEVFEYLSRDTPYAAIALDLKISVATVRTHTRAVFRKLGVKSRRELVAGRSQIGRRAP
jgi:DNA-binding NarL/FixJ family response regulator